jgi:hypothetical protein
MNLSFLQHLATLFGSGDGSQPLDPNDPSNMAAQAPPMPGGQAPMTNLQQNPTIAPPVPTPQMPQGGPPPPGQPPLPSQYGTAPSGPPTASADPAIEVQGIARPHPKVHDLITGGTFGVGHTGGNILGALGDAFLTQAGHAAQYAPRLEQAKESEAMSNFNSDPVGAIQAMSLINPDKAEALRQQIQTNDRADAANARAGVASTDAHQNNSLEYDTAVKGRIGAFVNSANEKSWPGVKANLVAYAQAHNIDPKEIPDNLEDAKQWARGAGMTVAGQVGEEDKVAEHADTLQARRDQIAANMEYRREMLAERDANHKGVLADRQNRTDGYLTGVDKAPDRSKWTQSQKGGGGGGVKLTIGPDGKPMITR